MAIVGAMTLARRGGLISHKEAQKTQKAQKI
jgi:hypothetical protein